MKKSRFYTTLNASIAMFLGGTMLLTTGFWLYNPENESIDLLPETGAATLTVCPDGINPPEGCQYFGGDGIQQAVDAAQNGDTVLVKAGSYSRDSYHTIDVPNHSYKWKCMILVNKSISIIGEGESTIINGLDSAPMGAFIFNGDINASISKMSVTLFKFDQAPNGNGERSYGDGVLVNENSTVIIQDLYLGSNGGAGIYEIGSNVTIINNLISGNRESGININSSNVSKIYNNTIAGNARSGIFLGDTAQATITNNITFGNGIRGIIGPNEAAFTSLKYNLSFGNTVANWNEPNNEDFENWPPVTNLTADPKLVSEVDFHLQPGSPAINAGDPSILDPDGSRSDIGAYGGPGACGLDPSLPGCVPAAPAPTALQITCDNGNANFSWNASTGVDKFILRINHEPKNAQGGINTAQCKNTAGATVGWFCNTATAGTQCLSSHGCDDQYKIVNRSTSSNLVGYVMTLKPGEQYAWSVHNQVNGVEGAGAGSLDTNIFTCSSSGSTQCKPMDVNSDGKFNITDLASFAQGYPNRTCTKPAGTTPACGWEDVNGDTKIDIADFASFAQRYYTHHASCAL